MGKKHRSKIDNKKIVGSFKTSLKVKNRIISSAINTGIKKKLKKFSEKLLDNMAEGFSVIDTSGHQVVVNPSVMRNDRIFGKRINRSCCPYPYWPEEEIENIGANF